MIVDHQGPDVDVIEDPDILRVFQDFLAEGPLNGLAGRFIMVNPSGVSVGGAGT